VVYLLTSSPTPTISITIAPDYVSDGLQAAYVILTLIIVIISIWSVRVSRKQSLEALNISRAQVEKSEIQSKAALEESRKQSQLAIDVMREQIESSKLQAQEAIYNQIRPIIVCTSPPFEDTKHTISINLVNVGFGVANDVWGYYNCEFTEEPSDDIPPSEPPSYSFKQSMVFLPNKETKVTLIENDERFPFPSSIEKYSLHPHKDSSVSYQNRLLLTYSDAFNNRYLSVFDYNHEYGWKQIASEKTEKTLDELIISGRITVDQSYEEEYQQYLYWKEQEKTK